MTRTERAEHAKQDKADGRSAVMIRLPADLPPLTRSGCRALLAILVELTEVPLLNRSESDESGERGRDDHNIG